MALPPRPSNSSPSELDLLMRYAAGGLLVVGGLEWLLGRTVSRMAAAPTLDGPPRAVVEWLGRVGLNLVSPAVLLALALYLLSLLRAGSLFLKRDSSPGFTLCMGLAVFGLLAGAHTFFPTLGWLNIVLNLLALLSVWGAALYGVVAGRLSTALRVALLLVALGYTGWFYYVLEQDFSEQGVTLVGLPLVILNLGEIAAVAAPFAFFAALALPYGQWKHAARWVFPVVAALVFSGGNVADAVFNQGFSGVFVIWSLGMNLFLPWPLYAIALMLFLYALLSCFSRGGAKAVEANGNTGLGLLLLLYAGYALQVPYQFVLAVLSLLLFGGLAQPFDGVAGESDEVSAVALRRGRQEAWGGRR